MIRDLREGEFVYVRMQVRRAEPSETDSFACKLLMPIASASFAFSDAYQVLWIPRSQIVCREPEAMEADNGIVRGID